MDELDRYRLVIDAWSPQTIPLERLAAYLGLFARVLGERSSVHLDAVESGSLRLVAAIDPSAAPRVEARMLSLGSGDAPSDARTGLAALRTMLHDDGSAGAITGPGEVIHADFQGRVPPASTTFGHVRERHFLDGVVVKIGGLDATVPVWLKDGEAAPHICEASIEMSKRLAGHYRRSPIRAHGVGTWSRDVAGAWRLLRFRIESFDALDERPLADVVDGLQAVGGSRWHEAPDPMAEAIALRAGHD